MSPGLGVQARPSLQRAIELLWFDPEALPRLRRHRDFRALVGESALPKLADEEFDTDAPPEKRALVRDRRDITALLTKGEPRGVEGVQKALGSAVSPEGSFIAPFVLVEGDVEVPFDELETLKATIAALSPFMAGDKRLKEEVETVSALLGTPWLEGANSIAEGLTLKLRDTFVQRSRTLPAQYLETHTERLLLERRCYQKRRLFGQTWLRGLLSLDGDRKVVPTYLPEALGGELPMFQRFRVRVIAEARLQVDQFEDSPLALKATALGRILPTTISL